MTSYQITLAYTISENFTVQAESLKAAEERAALLAESRLEGHDCSEATYEVLAPDNECVQGAVYG